MSNLNYFGEREQRLQKQFAKFRSRVSQPMLVALERLKVTPFQITTVSAMFGLIFGGLVAYRSPWAIAFFALHLLADSLDGSLARHLKVESKAGAFMDMVTDHIGLMAICGLGAIYGEQFALLFPVYGFTYITLIVLVSAGNAFGVRNNLVVRTKYAFFGVVCLNLFFPLDQFLRGVCYFFIFVNAVVIAVAWWKMSKATHSDIS